MSRLARMRIRRDRRPGRGLVSRLARMRIRRDRRPGRGLVSRLARMRIRRDRRPGRGLVSRLARMRIRRDRRPGRGLVSRLARMRIRRDRRPGRLVSRLARMRIRRERRPRRGLVSHRMQIRRDRRCRRGGRAMTNDPNQPSYRRRPRKGPASRLAPVAAISRDAPEAHADRVRVVRACSCGTFFSPGRTSTSRSRPKMTDAVIANNMKPVESEFNAITRAKVEDRGTVGSDLAATQRPRRAREHQRRHAEGGAAALPSFHRQVRQGDLGRRDDLRFGWEGRIVSDPPAEPKRPVKTAAARAGISPTSGRSRAPAGRRPSHAGRHLANARRPDARDASS